MKQFEVSAKTVEEALTTACEQLGASSDRVEYEVIDEGASGFLGIGAKQAVIKARLKESDVVAVAKTFLNDVFAAMQTAVSPVTVLTLLQASSLHGECSMVRHPSRHRLR